MRSFFEKRKLKNAADDFLLITRAPFSELYEGRLEDEKVLLTEGGLVVHIDSTPNRMGDLLFSKDLWLEITPAEGGIELHLWNSEGAITLRPLVFSADQVLGKARQMLADGADAPGGIQVVLLHERSDGSRGLKTFPSSPEGKYLVCEVLGVSYTEPRITAPIIIKRTSLNAGFNQ